MKKTNFRLWTTYRLTWVLYLGLAIIPFAIYIVHNQIQQIAEGEATVRKVSENGGAMLALTLTSDPALRKRIRSRIVRNFRELSPWYRERIDSSLYVGSSTPWRDFQTLLSCWHDLDQNLQSSQALKCWSQADTLAFVTERTNMLIMDRILNSLLASIALSIGLLILLIYVMKRYAHHQICERIIHSPEEALHDREFCLLSLKHLCAQAQREGLPLSSIHIHLRKKKDLSFHHSEKLAQAILQIESVLKDSNRLSNIICRIANTEFMILMPNTNSQGAHEAKGRIQDLLFDAMDKLTKTIDVIINAYTRKNEESCEDFWHRSLSSTEL